LEMDGTVGLSDVLLRYKSFEQAITQSPQQRSLFVMPAGRVPSNPSELLSGSGMKELLRICRRCFDYVVIDTPPILSVADGLSLAAQVDAVLLVVRAEETSKEAVLQTRYLLMRARAAAGSGAEWRRHTA
jgi:polysaccharide biosynthesis transport protein